MKVYVVEEAIPFLEPRLVDIFDTEESAENFVEKAKETGVFLNFIITEWKVNVST